LALFSNRHVISNAHLLKSKLKPEDRLLLICLRQDFTTDHIQTVCELAANTTLNWDRIALTAEQHGVSSLIYRNLSICIAEGLNIQEDAFKTLKMSAYKSTMLKKLQTDRLFRALSFFDERNLDVMLIKGAALDCCVYKNPDYVLSDDIDIIIRAKREDLTYEQVNEITSYFHRQGIEFDFFSHHDININGLLPIDFKSIWQQAMQIEYIGHPVFLMSSNDLLLSLCINSSRKRYVRMKSLFDISETIQNKLDISWEEVAKTARSYQCENIIYTALLVTALTTNCCLPMDWETYFKIHPFRQQLIKTTANSLIKKISFYPYPFSGMSVLGRAMHLSLVLPYLGYTRTQTAKKIAYAVHVQNN
jgi:hypothetical protein